MMIITAIKEKIINIIKYIIKIIKRKITTIKGKNIKTIEETITTKTKENQGKEVTLK